MMEPQPLEFEGTWEEICAYAHLFAGRRVRLIAMPQEPQGKLEAKDARTLEEKIAELVASVPEEEWTKLPADLGDNLHHYMYGTPKGK